METATKAWNWILNNLIMTSRRKLTGRYLAFANLMGGLMAIFYFYTSGFGVFSPESHRGIFFGVTLMLVFLWYPFTNKSPKDRFTIADLILALLSLSIGIYWTWNYQGIVLRNGYYTPVEIYVGYLAIILSIEGARRSVGAMLAVIGIGALLYAWKGVAPNLGLIFGHPGFDHVRISTFLFTSMDGIFGTVDYTLATYVMPFVIFGAFLSKSGVGRFFIELPYAMLGKYPAGTAQVSTLGSCLMGMISGSPVANVVATGSFTIPLMKRAGYTPETAGAIAAAGATGGMFTPPVMGAAAFFMVEFTGIPYVEIIKIAFIPAMLYYIGIATMVQIEAKKTGMSGASPDSLPPVSSVFKKGWFFLLPIFVIVALLALNYSPNVAAFWGSVSCFLVSWFNKENRMGVKQLWETMASAGKDIMIIASVTGVIGILVGVLTLTGLGLTLSQIILKLAGGSLLVTIILAGIVSFILGMGAPISAVYVILAVIVPPAMQQLGVPVIASHLLLIWYSQTSGLTPPVCLVAYAAAAMAQANPFKTGLISVKYGMYLLVLPLLFVYTPLLFNGTPFENWLAVVTSLMATFTLAFFLQNFFLRKNSILEQLLFAVGSILLFTPHLTWNIAGTIIAAIPIILQLSSRPRINSKSAHA